MEKLYFLLLSLLSVGSLRAQTIDSMRYQLDQVFAHVDKSQIPTRLLDAYALPLVPLAPFNGVLQDSVLLNPDLFRGLYTTAYTACIYGANPLPTLQAFNAKVATAEAAAGPDTLPVMMQLISYATLRPEARSQNLLTVQNQQLYDVAGRYDTPYSLCTLFAAAPAHTYCPSGNVSLMFPSTLFTTYLPERGGRGMSQSMEVDFGDGRGYVAAQFDQPISAAYTTAGSKQVRVRYTYQYTSVEYERTTQRASSSSVFMPAYVLETRFGLTVGAPATYLVLDIAKGGATTNATASTTASASVGDSVFFAAQPGRASGWAYIHYADGHSQLTKPLIVAKGFDGHFIAPDVFPENYSIRKFLREITTSPGFNFYDALENVGKYDIVFIDYTNGTDDILLNAGLFEAVLTYVNQQKDPSAHEQNVVMGLSMGGNIARYKLAEMTKAGRPTDVRLLVLNDSPQRGANIPLGLSALVRQLQLDIGPVNVSDMVAAVKQANDLLDSPAAQQLLLYQTYLKNIVPPGGGSVLGTTVEFRSNSFIEGPYRQMISYSAPYKIITVSQGSQCGNGLFDPYTELIRAGGRLNLYNLPFFLAGSEGINGEVIVNAIPANGQAQRVSGLHVFEETQVFFGLIKKRADITRLNFTCPTGLLPLDGASGGTEGIGSQIGTTQGIRMGTFDLIPNLYKRPYAVTFSLVSDFSFIPTPSGLDIQDFTLPSLSASYINGVASTSFSRADKFLAQARFTPASSTSSPFNRPHVSFTPTNTEWIYNEMQRPFNASNYINTVGCSAECTPLTITSPLAPGQRLCAGSSATFSIPGLAAGTPVSWSATPAGNLTVATGSGPTFTATASSSATGNTIITALVGECQTSVSISVPTGPGEPKGYYNSGGGSGTLGSVQYVGPAGPDGLDIGMFLTDPYNFTFTADLPGLYLTNTSGTATHFILKPGQGVRITATATNAPCGLVGNFVFICRSSSYFVATPNPASTELTVAATDPATGNPVENAAAYDADLYDTYGKKVKTKHSTHGKAVLDVRELPDGLYNLRVGQGKDAYSQHIQVKH